MPRGRVIVDDDEEDEIAPPSADQQAEHYNSLVSQAAQQFQPWLQPTVYYIHGRYPSAAPVEADEQPQQRPQQRPLMTREESLALLDSHMASRATESAALERSMARGMAEQAARRAAFSASVSPTAANSAVSAPSRLELDDEPAASGHEEASSDDEPSERTDAKALARKIGEFADEMKDKMFHGGAHLRLHNMSLEVFKLQGVPAEMDRQLLEQMEDTRAMVDDVLERLGARRERERQLNQVRTAIGSLQETEWREVEEIARLQAESAAMSRRVDDAKARREKARADLDALHCVYGMNSERAELDEKQAASLVRHHEREEQERKRRRE